MIKKTIGLLLITFGFVGLNASSNQNSQLTEARALWAQASNQQVAQPQNNVTVSDTKPKIVEIAAIIAAQPNVANDLARARNNYRQRVQAQSQQNNSWCVVQ